MRFAWRNRPTRQTRHVPSLFDCNLNSRKPRKPTRVGRPWLDVNVISSYCTALPGKNRFATSFDLRSLRPGGGEEPSGFGRRRWPLSAAGLAAARNGRKFAGIEFPSGRDRITPTVLNHARYMKLRNGREIQGAMPSVRTSTCVVNGRRRSPAVNRQTLWRFVTSRR